MPANFLSLPRELRDQVYLETLYADGLTRVGARAEKDIEQWFAGRQHLPGYHRPLLHYHLARGPPGRNKPHYHWSHETRVAQAPAIFHVSGGVGAEARELYLKSHILLEMKIYDDCDESVGRWMEILSEPYLNMIQRLHVYVHVRLFFDIGREDATMKGLHEARDYDIDLVDPIFRFELRKNGTELVVLTAARVRDQATARIQESVEAWNCKRERPGTSFTGQELLLVARQVLEVLRCHMQNIPLQADITSSDIVHVDKHEGKCDDYGTVVRLSSGYPYVVARLASISVRKDESPDIGCLDITDR